MSYVFMMDSTYHDLAYRSLELLKRSHNYRMIILIIGAPGSGKTTVAQRVCDIINNKFKEKGSVVNKPLKRQLESLDNEDLPKYKLDDDIDYEDENYETTVENLANGDIIIRGRGGDDTAIKISSSFNDLNGINKEKEQDGEEEEDTFAQVIPMDGFHLPRAVLKKFKDSDNAFKRRGAPFTFDSSLIVKLIENINKTLKIEVDDDFNELNIIKDQIPNIYIPTFNHSEHDPKQFGAEIKSTSRILIMEGLYLLLDNPVWCNIAKTLNPNVEIENPYNFENLMKTGNNKSIKDIPIPYNKNNEFWKILIDDSKMLNRVGKRHVKAGIASSLEEGEERVKLNDLPNGQRVYSESFRSDLNIISIDDINEC